MSFNISTAHFQDANPGGASGQKRLKDSMRKPLKLTMFVCLFSHLLGVFVLNKSQKAQDVGLFMGLPAVVPYNSACGWSRTQRHFESSK